MATPSQVIQGGSLDSQNALVRESRRLFSVENLGFMYAVLAYRKKVAGGAVGLWPLPIARMNVAITDMPTNDMGEWIYNKYVDSESRDQINIPGRMREALEEDHSTPADYDAAFTEIARMINADINLSKVCR